MLQQNPSVFLPGSSTPSPSCSVRERGTTWSQLPVFAVELMFSPGPIPVAQTLAPPYPPLGEGVGEAGVGTHREASLWPYLGRCVLLLFHPNCPPA